MSTGPYVQLLKGAFEAATAAAHPAKHLRQYLPPPPKGRLLVVGAGKAAAAMAQAVEEHYSQRLEGLVITRYGHELPTKQIRVVQAAHPVPDESGVRATREILELCSSLSADDLLLCLISGGGSALLSAPDGVSYEQKAALTQALLKSGADIIEMNTVRKHLSQVKGGGLAARAQPAQVVSLILSDVVGDDLSSIASGPTSPDPSSFQEALEILERYEIDAPEARRHLQSGAAGDLPETPKPGDPLFAQVENYLVASNQQSLQAAASYLEQRGIRAHILSSSITGEAREIAKMHAAIALQIKHYQQPFAPPCALISGGETTVTVRGKGRGGRNSEFALALALELAGTPGIYALAADTDGIDGTEDNAGAIITPSIFEAASLHKARQHLQNNDSYSFFQSVNALLMTGPTTTNVNDFRLILIPEA
ncbi:MAG: glycerate kinase [Chloroflexi bacterium AL-N5]|nr:glycerate kinase [Chloroflexi bacterium AL-N5]